MTTLAAAAAGVAASPAKAQSGAVAQTTIHRIDQTTGFPLSAVTRLLNPTDVVFGGLFPRWILDGLMDEIRLDKFDVPGRVPIEKPNTRTARVVGEDPMFVSAASVSVFRALSNPDPA